MAARSDQKRVRGAGSDLLGHPLHDVAGSRRYVAPLHDVVAPEAPTFELGADPGDITTVTTHDHPESPDPAVVTQRGAAAEEPALSGDGAREQGAGHRRAGYVTHRSADHPRHQGEADGEA